MIWVLASLLMLGAGLILIKAGQQEQRQIHSVRLEDDDYDPLKAGDGLYVPPAVHRYINGRGLDLPPNAIWGIGIVMLLGSIALLIALPTNLAVIGIGAIFLSVHMALQSVGQNRKKKAQAALPSFLNQVARRLSSGISVEHAFTDSMENLEGPLEYSMKRIIQRVGLGLELHQAFAREARTSNLQEFMIISTALHINEQFGGSIRSILEDIVEIMRLEDQSKRELNAQTGETRITAVVLTILPIAMGGLLIFKNPAFLDQMWADPLGQFLLMLAVGLQIVGVFALWRMVRAI